MPDQLVCISCWRWYEGRTTCPTCHRPLIDPVSGAAASDSAAGRPHASPLASGIPGGLGAGSAPGAPPVRGYPAGLGSGPMAGDHLALGGGAAPADAGAPPLDPVPSFDGFAAPRPARWDLNTPADAEPEALPPAPPVSPLPAPLRPPVTPLPTPPPPQVRPAPTPPPSQVSAAHTPPPPPGTPEATGWRVRAPQGQAAPGVRQVPAGPPTAPVPAAYAVVPSRASAAPAVPTPAVPTPAVPTPAVPTWPGPSPVLEGPAPQRPAMPLGEPGGVAAPARQAMPALAGPPLADSSGAGSSSQLLVGAAAALVCGLVIAVLWVAAALATGEVLAPFAVLVGAAVGLAMNRLGRGRGLPAVLGAGSVAVVVIGLGLVLSALAAYSHAQGASLLAALDLLDRSFLPQLWTETGVLGALLGVVGVAAAGVAVVMGGELKPSQRRGRPAVGEGGAA